jgi:predicted DNA-binding protein
MTRTIQIPTELEQRVWSEAAQLGLDEAAYVRRLIEQ